MIHQLRREQEFIRISELTPLGFAIFVAIWFLMRCPSQIIRIIPGGIMILDYLALRSAS